MGAFDGLYNTFGPNLILSLAHNRFTEFPIALADNSQAISEVGLQTLDLSYNLIEKLSQLPTNSSRTKEKQLLFNNNNIKILEYEAFKNKMDDVNDDTVTTLLDLSNNPIEQIELGAFSSVWLSQLVLTNLPNLTYIDVGITNGMTTFSLVVSNCVNFQSIIISDVNQVAINLTYIRIGPGTDLQNIDSQFQFWLHQSPINVLDISDNSRINCLAQIYWMAKFALCSTSLQIIIDNAYCAYTKEPLSQYLKIFEPSC